MTLAEVASALSASNVQVAVGRLEQYDKLYLVVSDTRFKKFDEIEHTVLRSKDRKSTRLNSSHPSISYAVFCLKKKTSIAMLVRTGTLSLSVLSSLTNHLSRRTL